MTEAVAITLLHDFLAQQGVEVTSFKYASIAIAIHETFIYLNQKILRSLIHTNLETNIQKEGFSLLITTLQEETIQRKDMIQSSIQSILNACENDNLDDTIILLHETFHIDYLLIECIQNTINEYENLNDNTMKTLFVFILSSMNKYIQFNYSTSNSNTTQDSIIDNSNSIDSLVFHGEYLENLIKSSHGDTNVLKTQMISDLHAQIINSNVFLHVLNDNIIACKNAGYINKLKLFVYMQSIIENIQIPTTTTTVTTTSTTTVTTTISSSHTPTFDTKLHDNESIHSKCIHNFTPTLNADNIYYIDPNIKVNNKKKSMKKALITRISAFTSQLGAHLLKYGWVACDGFLPIDLIRRIRIESNLFIDHFEQSEIWYICFHVFVIIE